MKIITPGNSPFRKRCDRCGCVFEYENSDVRRLENNYFGDHSPTVSCPTCNQDIYAPRIKSVGNKKSNGLEDFEGTYL